MTLPAASAAATVPALALSAALAVLGATPLAAAQDETPMPLTYAVFEEAIAHGDLSRCPDALAGPDRFCRVTIGHDAIHVFAFTFAGDSPLVGHAAFDAELLDEVLK